MGQALTITRTDRSSGDLRALAAKCRDGAQVRRLLALAMVLEGAPRSVGCRLQWHGPADTARLGAPLQRGWC